MKLSEILNELQGSSRRATLNISAFDLINTMDKVEQMGIPVDRFGDPKDVANTVLFLCSNLSDYITGETIHVNGGMYFS